MEVGELTGSGNLVGLGRMSPVVFVGGEGCCWPLGLKETGRNVLGVVGLEGLAEDVNGGGDMGGEWIEGLKLGSGVLWLVGVGEVGSRDRSVCCFFRVSALESN